MDWAAELKAMAEALEASGVEASVDPSELDLPGVYVTLDRLTVPTLGDGGLVRVRLFLIVPDQDDLRAVEALQALYTAVTAVVSPMSDVEATAARLPGNPPELPALTFTHDLTA